MTQFFKILKHILTSNYYDTNDLDKGKDHIIKTNKTKITLATTRNQKNNADNNITSINIGQCENLLREYYNLTNRDILYIKIIEVIQEGMRIPKIEYDVYSKLHGTNLTKLNATICKNTKITLSIPVIINEAIDKLNSSSGYFNNICYKSTSNYGTDISLKDRREDFINKNQTVCQDDCDFINYNFTTQKANCSCKF